MHDQNMAIVKSLVSVAWADGVYADEEREMIEGVISAFEATPDEAKEIREYAAEKKTLDDIPLTELSTDDRRVLVQHAVLLTFIDGTQAESEKKFIDELCERLRIPKDEAAGIISAAEARAKRFLAVL
ncbi:MAG TPA: TerB family tellurite resistance protein [Byssovorax sp.]|jgi:tellurite resistance protein